MIIFDIISLLVIFIFILAGFLHIYWGFGGIYWLDKAIPTVKNKPLISPSNSLTILVGLLLFGFSILVYLIYFYDLSLISYSQYIIYFGWFLAFAFALRAIGEFHIVGLFKKIKSSEFAKYDTLLYTPLFLFLSCYFMIVSYKASL